MLKSFGIGIPRQDRASAGVSSDMDEMHAALGGLPFQVQQRPNPIIVRGIALDNDKVRLLERSFDSISCLAHDLSPLRRV